VTITKNDLQRLSGTPVLDRQGDKIGKVGQVYLDDVSGEPTWVTVQSGLFGTTENFVPIGEADLSHDGLTVTYGKDEVKNAPGIDADGHLSPEESSELYRYYRLDDVDGRGGIDGHLDGDRSRGIDGDRDSTVGRGTDDAMTRAEERLNVGTRSEEVGRARLRKYVVSEQVTQTVPVSHEEVRIEREPITDANRDAATSGKDLSSEEHEVTLHAERPAVEKEAVPVERVRLGTETVRDEQQVTEDVSKEVIDTDGVDDQPARDRSNR
jgi:uncharacterized protein (TIGR02271 family)